MAGNRFQKSTYRISLGAMLVALTVLTLYIGAILPAGRISLYFISGIFIIPMLYEFQPLAAFLIYLISSAIGLLFMPELVMILPYVFLFGHYGIGKYLIEERFRKLPAMIVKFVYYAAFTALIYFVCFQAFSGGILDTIPVYLTILILIALFFVYDFAYSLMVRLYNDRIGRFLMRR
jgi:hypothetical protein